MKQGWETVKLGEVLTPSENGVAVVPTDHYKMLGLSLEGRGLFVREEKLGSEVSAKYLNKVIPGEFIYSRLFAWKGAFDKVAKDFEGCYVSDEFPAFQPDKDKLDIDFLAYFFKQKSIWMAVEQYCIGVTKASRNRFKEQFFLNFEIPLPPLSEQQHIAGRLSALKGKIDAVRALREEQEKEMKGLLLTQYQEIIEGAQWKPLKEVAPIIRRDVEISEDGSYPELGIRSFGKGTFHKPALTGFEVGTKRLYKIEAGDLMFSNVFAWEGAIAVAQKEDHGRFGSHRFISCVCEAGIVLPEFLCFHFLTNKGMEDINIASPGGAGRNKTLGLNKLENTPVPVPELRLQKKFLELQTQTKSLKAAQAQQLTALEGVFPAVLERAFRGEW